MVQSIRGLRVTKIVAAVFGLLLASGCGHNSTQELDRKILSNTQELFDALAPGNRQPWSRYIANDVMYIDEQGHNMDKKALLATIEALPSGITGAIKVVNSKVNVQGETLIHSYDMDETENVHGQELHARYHATDTWMNRNGQWQIIAGQVLRYYEDPAPGQVDKRKFSEYLGTYKLGDEREVVSAEHGQLYLTRGRHPRVELIPETCDIFFRKGVEGRELFHYANGQMNSLIDRRNNEDIVWEKVH